MYYVHAEGIKSHLWVFKNAKKEKLSNFKYQNMFKSELENQKKNLFFSFFLGGGENFSSSVSSACKINKYDHAMSKFKNFEHFRPFLIPWSFS